jgi:hypothetical protein
VVTQVFFDTSIFVAGLVEMGRTSEAPQRALAAVAGGHVRKALTAWHCCLEFYSVVTRLPEELRLLPAEALQLIEGDILDRFDVCQLPGNAQGPFLKALEHDRIVGGRVHDAHIAEIARLSAAKTVVTDNRRHFASLARHGIRVLSAQELVTEMDDERP